MFPGLGRKVGIGSSVFVVYQFLLLGYEVTNVEGSKQDILQRNNTVVQNVPSLFVQMLPGPKPLRPHNVLTAI